MIFTNYISVFKGVLAKLHLETNLEWYATKRPG